MLSVNAFALIAQLDRLHECEKMLVAMELANLLSDDNMHLQCIVQTYGLVSPILQAGIKSVPFMEVCFCLVMKLNNKCN